TRTVRYKTKEIDRVSKFILDASSEIQAYYRVKSNHCGIQSFILDEWMVLARKNENTHKSIKVINKHKKQVIRYIWLVLLFYLVLTYIIQYYTINFFFITY